MDYFDVLLAKKLEDDRDPKVEGLSVTENGRYHEDGVVYDPVIVNVPEPTLKPKSITQNGTYQASSDNADGYSSVDVHVEGYKISEVSGLPSSIATFSDGSNLPMPSLKIGIEPVQDLHGYDSPWVGGAGKNKLNLSDYTVKSYSDYGIATTVNGYDVMITITSYPLQQSTQSFAILTNSLPNIDKTNLGIKAFISAGSNYVGNVRWANAASNNNIAIDLQNLSQGLNATITMRVMVYEKSGGEPTTYAPYSNECPISGWDEANVSVSGVNIWDEEWEVGQLNYSNGNNIPSSTDIRSKNYIPCLPNTQYYIKCSKATIICGYDKNKNYVDVVHYNDSNRTFSTLDSVYYIRFCTLQSYGTTYNNDISINYPSTDTEYHAYNGQTYTIDLDGTRYGGTLDVVSGVLTVDRAYVDLGTLTYSKAVDGLFRLNPNSIGVKISSDMICSIYEQGTRTDYSGWNARDFSFGWLSTNEFIMFKDSRYTEASDFKTAMDGVQLVYELATPTTFYTQPTAVKSLNGQNNLFADCGDVVEASYWEEL